MQKVILEKEAEDFLEKRGFRVIQRVVIKKNYEIKEASKKIPFPWAMKVSSKKIIHKAKAGGVILDIKNEDEAKDSFKKISKLEGFEFALIQPMLSKEYEFFILGLKKTPEFGIVAMIGKGGSKVEEERDVSFRVVPLNANDAEDMIKELKFYENLKNKKINLRILKKNLFLLSKLASENKNISELDINPLAVNSRESLIIDARIVFKD